MRVCVLQVRGSIFRTLKQREAAPYGKVEDSWYMPPCLTRWTNAFLKGCRFHSPRRALTELCTTCCRFARDSAALRLRIVVTDEALTFYNRSS